MVGANDTDGYTGRAGARQSQDDLDGDSDRLLLCGIDYAGVGVAAAA